MKSSAFLAAALAAGLLLGGCGSGDPERLTDEGYLALNSGRCGEALDLFDRALRGMEAAHTSDMTPKSTQDERIAKMTFASVYPLLLTAVEIRRYRAVG